MENHKKKKKKNALQSLFVICREKNTHKIKELQEKKARQQRQTCKQLQV